MPMMLFLLLALVPQALGAHQAGNQSSLCQCTFSVTGPPGSLCPEEASPAIQALQRVSGIQHGELEALRVRLGSLESRVQRLTSKQAARPRESQAGPLVALATLRRDRTQLETRARRLQAAYGRLLRAKTELQEATRGRRRDRSPQASEDATPGSREVFRWDPENLKPQELKSGQKELPASGTAGTPEGRLEVAAAVDPGREFLRTAAL